MEIQLLDPKDIKWPEVRVTAYYQEGQEEMLRQSLDTMGQQQPLVVVKVGDEYIGVDGMHRCQAAFERGDPTIPCVVKEGTEKDALFSNLVLNHLRGRTKASEQVAVIGELFDKMGVTIDEIGEYTGHGRDWVDQHILVSRATNPVRQALDEELITLGHAHALAQIEDKSVQERVCHQLLLYRWTIKELREHIKGTLGQVQAKKEEPALMELPPPIARTCSFCHHEEDPDKVAFLAVCVSCSGVLVDYHRRPSRDGGGGSPA